MNFLFIICFCWWTGPRATFTPFSTLYILFAVVVISPKQTCKTSSALLCVFPIFSHHSANSRAVEDFDPLNPQRGLVLGSSPGVQSTGWGQCPTAPQGTGGENRTGTRLGWRILVFSADKLSIRSSTTAGDETQHEAGLWKSPRRAELAQDGFRQI